MKTSYRALAVLKYDRGFAHGDLGDSPILFCDLIYYVILIKE